MISCHKWIKADLKVTKECANQQTSRTNNVNYHKIPGGGVSLQKYIKHDLWDGDFIPIFLPSEASVNVWAGDIRKGETWRRASRFLFVCLCAEVINHSSQIYSKTTEQRRIWTKEKRKREKVRHEGKVPGQPKERRGAETRPEKGRASSNWRTWHHSLLFA